MTLVIRLVGYKIFSLRLISDVKLSLFIFKYCTILVLYDIQQTQIVRFIYLNKKNRICEYAYIHIKM